MITFDVLLLVAVGISAIVLYSMYRYFDGLIDGMYDETCKRVDKLEFIMNKKEHLCRPRFVEKDEPLFQACEGLAKRFDFEQKALSNVIRRLDLIEKNQTGSIKVVTPTQRNKNVQQRPTTTKTKPN